MTILKEYQSYSDGNKRRHPVNHLSATRSLTGGLGWVVVVQKRGPSCYDSEKKNAQAIFAFKSQGQCMQPSLL
ncbi:hypothetical protein HPP92_010194 [Vanilla planifolia]|uniref:Uncharacterized protein n=1 Tax=Vanilla planifolia TaxID=51239 RepID=A0A835V174_VANPL|nr:hypothetical protein HPP92_010194 [Vanilla planifolia]